MRIISNNIPRAAGFIYAAIFFVIISATVILSYLDTTKSLRRELEYSNTALLRQVMEKAELVLYQVDKDALSMLQEPEVRRFNDGNYTTDLEHMQVMSVLMNKLENMTNANTYLQSAYLYSYGQGKYVTPYIATDEAAFFDHGWRRGFDMYGGYYKWLGIRSLQDKMAPQTVNKQVLTLVRSYPAISAPPFRKGALILNIDEGMIYDIAQNDDVKRLGQVFIIDGQGQVISHSDKRLLGQNIGTRKEIARILNAGGEGHFAETVDGVPSTVFYATSEYTAWKYVSIIPDLQVSRELLTVRNWLLLIALVMFITAVVAVFVVNTVTFRPIKSFVRSINSQLASRNGIEREDSGRAGTLDAAEGLFDRFLIEHDSMKQQVRQNIPAMKWRLVSDILTGYRTDYSDIKPSLDWLGIRLYPAHYIVMIAEFDQKARISSKDLPLYAYALSNVAEELVNAESMGTAVEMFDGRVVMIISFETEDLSSNMLRALSVADLIRGFVQEQFKQTVTVGIGRQYDTLEGLNKSYSEAVDALQHRMLLGANQVISGEDVEEYNGQHFYRLFDVEEAILGAVKSANAEEVNKQLEQLFQRALKESVPPRLLKQISLQLVLRSLKIGSDIGLDMDSLIGDDAKLYEKVESAENASDIKRDITGFFNDLLSDITEKRSSRGSNETVERILAFISNHYMQSDLSMNMIADKFQLSVPYVSKIFKEYTESSFTDYLIRMRIDKAKELLEAGNAKIVQVAEAIGYTNSHSFIRIFKKATGLTPGEYREQFLLKNNKIP